MSYGEYLNVTNLEKRKVWSKLLLWSKIVSERPYVMGAPNSYELLYKAELEPVVTEREFRLSTFKERTKSNWEVDQAFLEAVGIPLFELFIRQLKDKKDSEDELAKNMCLVDVCDV